MENINKVGESSGDGKQGGDERICSGGGPGGGESAGFKYCCPGGLQGKWKQRFATVINS